MEITKNGTDAIAEDLAETFDECVKRGEESFTVKLYLYSYADRDSKRFLYEGRRGKRVYLDYTEDKGDCVHIANSVYGKFADIVSKRLGGYIMKKSTKTVRGRARNWWDTPPTYTVVNHFTFYRPCDEWAALVARLAELGVDTKDLGYKWRCDEIHGKRGDYGVAGTFYRCTDSASCVKALDLIKGVEKVDGFSLERCEDLEDMERGVRYETEWGGSIDYALTLSTPKGTISL